MAAAFRKCGYWRSPYFHVKRWNSVASSEALPSMSEEPNPLYPPIKPKYPPGHWGNMDTKYAWLWDKAREESLAIPNVVERIDALCQKEMNQFQVRVIDEVPRTLAFKKFVTKTHVESGLPEKYSSVLDSSHLDDLTARLAPTVCDTIVMEQEMLDRQKYTAARRRSPLSHVLIRSILSCLTTRLSAEFPHLLTLQRDEQVKVEAFWDRHGIMRKSKHQISPVRYVNTVVQDQRFTSAFKADFVLRTEKPLPEFVNRDELVDLEQDVAELKYHPSVFGQHFEVKAKRSVRAGHMHGDPCEFGFLSVLNSEWTMNTKGTQWQHPHLARDARIGHGIMASFLWLVAQAYNQGFNTFVELTYPLTTQAILTDGQYWQFLAYQLNSLMLWKDNDANPLANRCWVGDMAPLFEAVEGGKVHGFNPDVLKQLISCLALTPSDRPYDLKPTLLAAEPQTEFIPIKKEEVIVVEEEKYVIE